MAKDRLFFSKAGQLNASGVPSNALWIQCFWASVLCLSGKYGDLLTYSTFASLLFYVLTIAGIFHLRVKEPHTPRPYRAFGYPFIPALYIISALCICVILVAYSPMNTLSGLGIVCIGLPVYWFINRRQ
jgi:APA family basic amino acid/polyamine antiporter